jgi:hypothetical protein
MSVLWVFCWGEVEWVGGVGAGHASSALCSLGLGLCGCLWLCQIAEQHDVGPGVEQQGSLGGVWCSKRCSNACLTQHVCDALL